MKNLRTATRFRRDLKRITKRNYQLERLQPILDLLRHGRPLPARHRDHPLQGAWASSRECHITPDWLLIYETNADEVILQRTGTHSDLFGT